MQTKKIPRCGVSSVANNYREFFCKFCVDSTDPFAKSSGRILENLHRCVSPPSDTTAAWQCFVW